MIVIKHEMSIKKREEKCAIILCLPVEELENKEDKKWKKENGKEVLRKFNHIQRYDIKAIKICKRDITCTRGV